MMRFIICSDTHILIGQVANDCVVRQGLVPIANPRR